MIEPTSYPELNDVLQEMVASIRAILGEAFVGAYLQGSFAIGGFDEHSDVDFIVVMNDELTPEHVQALTVMHERIFRLPSEWARHLEGSYFPVEALRDTGWMDRELWYLDNGSQELERSDHCNSLTVRWTLRERGVRLAGPGPETLIDPVPIDALRREIAGVITGWGAEVLSTPDAYKNRFYQGFIVLNYCRMLHDLLSGEPSSKRTGAEWAKALLDPKWSPLIDRAWNGRPDPAVSVREPSDPADFESTLEFVELVIRETDKYMAGKWGS